MIERSGMVSTDIAPVSVRRADFMALVYAVLGLVYVLLVGWMVFTDGLTLDAGDDALLGCFWLAAAGYSHFRPEATRRGTDPAPRRWFELTGVVAVCLVLTLIGGMFFLSFG